jgi:hypothetical protein
MPQVPFSGVPSVAPQNDATPRYAVDARPESFGVNVGVATQGLGKAVEGAGNEIFARGIAMQDLYNHSEAQQADADYMQKAGEVHANFSSLQGKAAVDAYPQYIQDLKDLREKIGSGLSNGMSKKLYDGQSLSTYGRTVFNGAGHAASENKRYAVSSADGRIAASYDQTLNQPFDERGFQQSLGQNENDVRAKGQLEGIGPRGH